MSVANHDARAPASDLVGIGFGPSNLALAIAVEEHNRQTVHDPLDAVFLERQPRFGWHRGMLLEGATMRVSFLKDLVTMRDPASRFSFLSYLSERQRLADFINAKCLFPTREEFHDYLEWAAAHLAHLVHYGCEVTELRAVRDDDGTGRRSPTACGTTTTCSTGWPRCPTPPPGSSWSAPARARRSPPSTCTAASPTPRSARSSPATGTVPPTTPPSPTASSTPRRSTTSSAHHRRSNSGCWTTTATRTSRWSTPT